LKRRKIIAICIIAILAVSMILVAYNCYRNTQVDTSWVKNVNRMLKDYPSYINDTQVDNTDWTMSAVQVHLLENGTNRILYFGNRDNLYIFLISVLNHASIQKGTLSEAQLNQSLTSSKAVEITCRFLITVQSHHYSEVYFILESNQDIRGTIIVRDNQSSNINILAVSKLPKFP
jgi:hypothetical protein